jgi:hypothetical protein
MPGDGRVSGQKPAELLLAVGRVRLAEELALLALADVPVEHEVGKVLKSFYFHFY